ncbi:PfkB family carbohydrate kinase [Herbiconiux sp. UC225_62]|uniref:PfkB family carbohydrate kinase n=1 Tax=Herbiconiux sp. UC225_62 TaxID=3350168 RepID=UPI0036D39A2F
MTAQASSLSAPGVQVDSVQAEVVDTIGAGDSFMSGLLASIAGGEPLVDAARYAAECAAVTVSRSGAEPPTAVEMLERIGASR